MAEGIRIAHRTKRFGVATVPIWQIPIKGLRRPCPTCNIIHPVKTVHLSLDSQGTCLVSEGVLKHLKMAGMPDLDILATVKEPPPIKIGKNRHQNDQENAAIRLWKEPVIV